MREFRYSALTSSGRTVTGVRRAPDAEALAAARRAPGPVGGNVRPARGGLLLHSPRRRWPWCSRT